MEARMALSDWTRDSEGNVQCFPVAAWELVPTNDGTSGLVRIEYCTEPTLEERAAVQLNISTPQVSLLINELRRLADQLDRDTANSVLKS
jgi:hypothetical protein